MGNDKKSELPGPLDAFIDSWRCTLFTKKGDKAWKKFTDEVLSAPCCGYSTEPLEKILDDEAYEDEYKARTLVLAVAPFTAHPLPIYFPYQRKKLSFSRQIKSSNLKTFFAELIARSLAIIANCTGDRQDHLHYTTGEYGEQFVTVLNSADREIACKALDIIATAEMVRSFDNFDRHPLHCLYSGATHKGWPFLKSELRDYLDARIRHAVQTKMEAHADDQEILAEIFGKYVFLVRCIKGKNPGSYADRLAAQLEFILEMHQRFKPESTGVYRMSSMNIPSLFEYLSGLAYSSLRRRFSLYILEQCDLFLRENVMGHETALKGAMLMAHELHPIEDAGVLARLDLEISAYHDRVEKESKRWSDISRKGEDEKERALAKNETILAAMRYTLTVSTSQP